MYKDPDKQREANRQAQAKFKAKGITKGITNKGITERVLPERTALGNIRVSKPGDDDYVPMCETTRAFINNRDKDDLERTAAGNLTKEGIRQYRQAKRGKDIKTFNDLPPDVQATINRISQSNEEKQKRTAAAIKYQHLFPDRFHSTGCVSDSKALPKWKTDAIRGCHDSVADTLKELSVVLTPDLGQDQTVKIG